MSRPERQRQWPSAFGAIAARTATGAFDPRIGGDSKGVLAIIGLAGANAGRPPPASSSLPSGISSIIGATIAVPVHDG